MRYRVTASLGSGLIVLAAGLMMFTTTAFLGVWRVYDNGLVDTLTGTCSYTIGDTGLSKATTVLLTMGYTTIIGSFFCASVDAIFPGPTKKIAAAILNYICAGLTLIGLCIHGAQRKDGSYPGWPFYVMAAAGIGVVLSAIMETIRIHKSEGSVWKASKKHISHAVKKVTKRSKSKIHPKP